MDGYPRECYGRQFVDSEYFNVLTRIPIGISRNKVWCYTVERAIETSRETRNRTNANNPIIRLIRWKARNDRENPEIKYWRYGSSYTVRSLQEWERAKPIINSLISEEFINPEFIEIPIEEYRNLIDIKDALEQEIERLKSIKAILSAETKIFKKRLQFMRKEREKYDKVLKHLSKLINEPKTTETKIHNYIKEKKPFWLFGLEYVDLDSKIQFPPDSCEYEFDIMLQRFDSFHDLVELKGPNEKLFRKINNRYKPSSKLSEALGQVFRYIYACETNSLYKDLLKPQAYIVIGNKGTDNLEERRLFSSFLNGVTILTYSELIQNGYTLLDYIDSSRA